MSQTIQRTRKKLWNGGLLLFILIMGGILSPGDLRGETYGIVNALNEFESKVTIEVKSKEIVIRKTNPQEKFESISLQVNPRNNSLMRNVGLLKIEWIDARKGPGRPLPFAGPRYDSATRTFEDTMVRSVALRILNQSRRTLFKGRTISDLFIVKINNEPVVSSESVQEQRQRVQLGAGQDMSIKLDHNSITFNENNFKGGEILNVDNRSGRDQVLGVELPVTGLLYYQIIRKPEQTKIPKADWGRFTVAADSGIFIVLIPEPDPSQLARLDGQDIVINVFEGNTIRERRRIPIRIAADLRLPGRETTGPGPITPGPRTPEYPDSGQPSTDSPQPSDKEDSPRQKSGTTDGASSDGTWLWALLITNTVLAVGLAVYGIFFLLPRIQVLQDRLAKNEMFIHGSREAIREELEQIKRDILDQCLHDRESD